MKVITRTLVAGALAVATLASPIAALAQTAPTIIIVDLARIGSESAASKSAEPQLKAKFDAIQARGKALGDQFRVEYENLQKAQPSMAKEAFQEMRGRQEDANRSVQYVRQQILTAVNPIITALMREKGASLALDREATLAISPSLDVTADVLTRLNTALPRVGITPPAAPAAAAAPKQ
jgi:outer membrane protein